MSRFNSRHMLPLGRFFSNSTSKLNLHAESRAHEDFDFSDDAQNRPETSHCAFSPFSMPDLNATALPDVPPLPQQFGGPAPAHAILPATEIHADSPLHSADQNADQNADLQEQAPKGKKGAGWRKFKVKVKKVFTLNRHKNRSSSPIEEERTPIQIGNPFGFQHQLTFGHMPLRTASGRIPNTAGSHRETLAMQEGANAGRGVGTDTEHVARPGSAAAAYEGEGEGGEAEFGQLGRLDSEGTAVESRSASSWETCDATRIFVRDKQEAQEGGARKP